MMSLRTPEPTTLHFCNGEGRNGETNAITAILSLATL